MRRFKIRPHGELGFRDVESAKLEGVLGNQAWSDFSGTVVPTLR